MNKIILTCVLLLFSSVVFARDTYVKGYYKKNGTYVQPHIRSAPDQYKWNNYGKESGSNSYYSPYMSPYNRDYDKDGILNQYDRDDNNNGALDDNER